MRNGFTTGSCAAAASKAACYMLLTGTIKESILITTPKGIDYEAQISDIEMTREYVSCAVVKDGGDDPDVTSGAHIFARVSLATEGIHIDGGIGVGRVTKPGLDQPVGSAAINHVPRQMITEAVKQVMDICDYKGGLDIIISVPEGEEISKKTFNPRLGIEGGISIIGTSGIVEPMSTQAIKDTILVELKQRKALGFDTVIMSPGNYGTDFMKNYYGYDLDKSIKCSNYIGESIDFARELGFKKLLLTGHVGKLVKLSGGIMNTHSKEADCRMELMAAAAFAAMQNSVGKDFPYDEICAVMSKIYDCVTTESACNILQNAGILEETMNVVMQKSMMHLKKRANNMQIECIMFSNEHGFLAASDFAKDIVEENI